MESYRPNFNYSKVLDAFNNLERYIKAESFNIIEALRLFDELIKLSQWKAAISIQRLEERLTFCIAKIILETNAKKNSALLVKILNIFETHIPIRIDFKNSDYTEQFAKYRQRCLLDAVTNRSLELVEYLLQGGITPDQTTDKDVHTDPVVAALARSEVEIAGLLLQARCLNSSRSSFDSEISKMDAQIIMETEPENKRNITAPPKIVSFLFTQYDNKDTKIKELKAPINALYSKLKKKIKKRQQQIFERNFQAEKTFAQQNLKSNNKKHETAPKPVLLRRRTSSISKGMLHAATNKSVRKEINAIFSANPDLAKSAIKSAAKHRHAVLLEIALRHCGDVNLILEKTNINDFLEEEQNTKNELYDKTLRTRAIKMLGPENEKNEELIKEQMSILGDQLTTRLWNNRTTFLSILNFGVAPQNPEEALEITIFIFASDKKYFANPTHKAALMLPYLLIAEEGLKKLEKTSINNVITPSKDDAKLSIKMLDAMAREERIKAYAEAKKNKDQRSFQFVQDQIKALKSYCILALTTNSSNVTMDMMEEKTHPQPWEENKSDKQEESESAKQEETESSNKQEESEIPTETNTTIASNLASASMETYEKIIKSGLWNFLIDIQRYSDSPFLKSLNWENIHKESGCLAYSDYLFSHMKQLSSAEKPDHDVMAHLASLVIHTPAHNQQALSILEFLSKAKLTNFANIELAKYYYERKEYSLSAYYGFQAIKEFIGVEPIEDVFNKPEFPLIFPTLYTLFSDASVRREIPNKDYFSFIKYDDFLFVRKILEGKSTKDKIKIQSELMAEVNNRIDQLGPKEEIDNSILVRLSDLKKTLFNETFKGATDDINQSKLLTSAADEGDPIALFLSACLTMINSRRHYSTHQITMTEEQGSTIELQNRITKSYLTEAMDNGHALSRCMNSYHRKNKLEKLWKSVDEKFPSKSLQACFCEFLKPFEGGFSNKIFKKRTSNPILNELYKTLNSVEFESPEDMILEFEEISRQAHYESDKKVLKLICFLIHKLIENYDYFHLRQLQTSLIPPILNY